MVSARLDPLFAAIYPSYRDRPAGQLVVANPNDVAVERLRARIRLSGAPAGPLQLDLDARLDPGETLEVPITLVLAAAVGAIDRAARVEVTVQLVYAVGEEQQDASFSVPGELYGYEAIRWTDVRRAAAFVTHDQPLVARFGQAARDVAGGRPVATAAALWAGLSEAGVSHTRDFFTPFADALLDPTAIDFVRYPVQSLAERWGDELELSLLIGALLEAAGVKSSLLVVGGRALIAFAPGAEAAELPRQLADSVRTLANEPSLILDVTETGSLRAAASRGAELLAGVKSDEVEIVIFRDAWADYPPVAGPNIAELPVDAEAVVEAMRSAVRELVNAL